MFVAVILDNLEQGEELKKLKQLKRRRNSFIFEISVLNKKVKSACVVSIFVAFSRESSTFVMVRVCYQLWFVDGFVVFEPGKLFLKVKFYRKVYRLASVF